MAGAELGRLNSEILDFLCRVCCAAKLACGSPRV